MNREEILRMAREQGLPETEVERGWGQYPLFTAPPKREWVGLTDEEIAQGPQEVLPALYGRWGWAEKEAFEAVVAWAEAKLKEKNT